LDTQLVTVRANDVRDDERVGPFALNACCAHVVYYTRYSAGVNTRYSGFMDKLEELAQVTKALEEARKRVAGNVQYRDRTVREALAAGFTWAQVQEVSHLSPRGVALATKRDD
jgi:hypothetical protein